MASPQKRLPANVLGDFFVDDTCIDCGACRWVAPESFEAHQDKSRVFHQPANEAQLQRAQMALLACPVGSIGDAAKRDTKGAREAFPERISEGVYYCGYHAESSFGATSYFLQRPQGNVLIDSPRFTRQLVAQLEKLGGVRWMFLTHRDDVADHQRFREHFGCERILHRADTGAGTRDIERQPSESEPFALDEDLFFIPTPGHTRGSMCLLYQGRFLFTGDHLFWDDHSKSLYASREVCWYSWPEQRRSMERLAGYSFSWVLPGHSHWVFLPPEEQREKLRVCLEEM